MDATDNSFTLGTNQAGKGSTSVTNGEVNTTGDTGVGYKTDYVNQFGNHFSWWLPQRLAMGSKLEQHGIVVNDADKYQPEVQTITTDTTHKLSDLNVKNGITDLIGPDGKISYDGKIDWTKTHWYNSAQDGTNWAKIMGSNQVPKSAAVDTDGYLKEGTTSNTATVVYTDGSIDFVNISLVVSNEADNYQPETQIINTDLNHKLSDLSVENGIKDLIGPNGVVNNSAGSPDLSSVDWSKTRTAWIANTLKDENGHIINPTEKFPRIGKYSALANIYYRDGSHDEVTITIQVGNKDSYTYDCHYQGTKVEKGKETDVAKPTIKNSSTGSTVTDEVTPSYSAVTTGSDQTPSWVKVNNDGSLKLTPGDNVTVGMKNIPIQVKYGDGSSEITDAPVYISDGDHSVIWGHDANDNTIGAVVLVTDPSKLNAHETSDNSQVLTPTDAVTDIEEYTVGDNGKATLTGHLDKNKVKISWEEAKTPNTIVTTPSPTGSTSGTLHVDLNGQANTYLGNNSGSVFENNMTIPMVGAIAKNPSTPVNVGFNTKLTQDEFNDLVVNNIPADEIAGYAWHNADGTDTLPEKATTATIRITFKDKDKNDSPTYLDIKLPANSIKVTSDADNYTVAYGDIKVARPNDDSTNSENEEPTITPSTVPDGTISNYSIDSSFTSPTGVTISVDKNGKITATANKNAILGSFKVPVNVTYADTSTAKVNVTVSVTGFDKDPHGGQTYYYGDQTMLTFGLPVITVHKTTGTNIYDARQIKFDTIYYYYNWSGQGYDASAYKNHTIYKLNADRTKYVNEADPTDTFNASDLHTSWRTVGGYTYQADTDESKFSDGTASTKYKNEDGSFNTEEQTAVGGTLPENLAGNSKYRFNFSFEGADVPSGIEVPDGIWSNVYFNFYGAKKGSPLEFKQEADDSNLTQEQYQTLIDVSDLGQNGWNGKNINPNAPMVLAYVPGTDPSNTFSMVWAPGTGANGRPSTDRPGTNIPGTVRIYFDDGTYLDVKAGINVLAATPDSSQQSFTQKIIYQCDGQEVGYTSIDNISKGSNLSADDLRSAINNNVPSNYSIKNNFVYPAARSNIQVAPAIIYVPLEHNDGDEFNAHGKLVYQLADGTHVADGGTISSHFGDTLTAGLLHDLADQQLPTGYQVVTYPDSFNVTHDNAENGFKIPVIIELINNGGGNSGGNGGGSTPQPNPNPKPDDNGGKKPSNNGKPKPGDNSGKKPGKTGGKKTPKPGKGKNTGHKKGAKPGKGGNKGGKNTSHKKPTNTNRHPGSHNGNKSPETGHHSNDNRRSRLSYSSPVKGQRAEFGRKRDKESLAGDPEDLGRKGLLHNGENADNGPELTGLKPTGNQGQSSQNNNHQRKTLPQTGQKHNNAVVLSALGLAVAGIAALLIMAGDRKRNN